MTTSTPADNTVLALSPPQVTGQTEPVVGANIGVPLVAYDLVTDGEGAVVLVDPPLFGTVDPGDVMELWLKDEPAALDSEIIADPDVRTRLRIPKGRLLPNRVNELYYTITRGSQNIGTLDPPLTILYNKIRPGLKDKYDASGGHSELKLLLPDVIKNGVGADFVSADVCVSYPYCRAYDRITLKCNGELLEPKPTVNPNQAPQPPNHGSEEPITICFTITRAFLDKAKRLDQKLYFSYTVTDQIGNGPDTDAPWSPVQVVDEDLDGKRLPKPILLERLEDFPGDDPEEIDLKKLAGNPLLLVVLTADNRFVAGDDVLATYTAQDTGQPAGVVVNVSGKVAADPFGVKKTLFLEVPNAKVFASSRVTVTYELRRPNGALVGNSITANATVTGITPIDLLPPFLVAPAVDPVDVLAYPNGITMRIEYLAALDGDRARLAEVNPPADSPQFPLVAFNSNKRVNTVLTPAYLAARQGKTFELRWNLNRNGGQAGKSTPTPMRVLKIADGDSRLPTPNIAGNTSTVLDVEALNDGARILAVKWPVFEPAQSIWVTCKGFDNNGNPISTNVRSGEPNDSLDGLNVQAPVAWLKALKDGSALTVECAVSLDGSRDRTKAVLLPLRLYTVRAVEDLNFGANLTLNLPAYSVVRGVPPLNPPANATYTRTPTGGIKPYHFSSSNTNVALIDATTGTVRVSGRGTTTLTVTDHQNNKATHTLTTTGLKMFVRLGSLMTQPNAAQACAAAGGGLPNNRAELRAVYNTYVGSGGIVQAAGWLPNDTWTNESHSQKNHYWVVRMNTGVDSYAHTTQGQSAVACRIDT